MTRQPREPLRCLYREGPPKKMRPKTSLSYFLTLAILLTSFAPVQARAAVSKKAQEDSAAESRPKGLRFRLSEGSAPGERERPNRVAAAEPLAEAETARLLARLPPLPQEPDDARAFSLRESTQPPPRAGQSIAAAFAPPDAPPNAGGPPPPAAVPLTVLRFAPRGEVELAPSVNVTFSRP